MTEALAPVLYPLLPILCRMFNNSSRVRISMSPSPSSSTASSSSSSSSSSASSSALARHFFVSAALILFGVYERSRAARTALYAFSRLPRFTKSSSVPGLQSGPTRVISSSADARSLLFNCALVRVGFALFIRARVPVTMAAALEVPPSAINIPALCERLAVAAAGGDKRGISLLGAAMSM